MTVEVFLEKFDLFVGAPNAVAKMRELVLELAVRGALSERLSTDQDDTAWRLLVSELDQRVQDSTLGSSLPFEIPDGWRWARLNDLGKTKIRNDVADETRVSFVPMALMPADYGRHPQWEERTWGEVKKAFTHFADGDVVVAKITPCFENGKSAVMRDLINKLGAGTTELHVFRRGTSAVLPEFVLIYLKTQGFIARGKVRMTGSAGQKRVPHDYFAASPFPLPPPAEQSRIVGKVAELMALCNRLESQQEEMEVRHATLVHASLVRFTAAPTPANLNFLFHKSYDIAPSDLRKSILTLAVQGKLVPQDPNDGLAADLLARIAVMRREKGARAYEPVTADEATYDIPLSWSWVRLGNLSLSSDSGWSPQCLPEARSGENWGVLKVSAVSWGVFKPEENKALPPGMTGRPDCEVKAGDFLLSRANTEELVARSVVVEQTPPRLMMSDKIVRFTFPDEIERAFINLVNTSDFSRSYYGRNASGTSSSMKNVGREVMCNLPIPLPPLAEQRRIVAKVDKLMALIDVLEAQLSSARTTAANLLEAIVAELSNAQVADLRGRRSALRARFLKDRPRH